MNKFLSILVGILKGIVATVIGVAVISLILLNFYSIASLQELRNEVQYVSEGLAVLGVSNDELSQQLSAISEDLVITKRDRVAAQTVSNNYLRDVTVMLVNVTGRSQGSGVWVQYEGQYYILTAGHMMDSVYDLMFITSKGKRGALLEIVNIDKANDLLLLKPYRSDILPEQFTTLDLVEPKEADQITLVGSPMGIEDLLSDGRVVHYTESFMYFFDHVYFGSSGGGVYNPHTGALVGIISHMSPTGTGPFTFVLHGAVRLDRIKEFMIQSTATKITTEELKTKMERTLDI